MFNICTINILSYINYQSSEQYLKRVYYGYDISKLNMKDGCIRLMEEKTLNSEIE